MSRVQSAETGEYMEKAQMALEDLEVLDLTHYTAGPYCAKMFADFGAYVIKVEKPGRGDGARRQGPFPDDIPDPEASGLFLNLNTNKLGTTINLKTEMGRQILLKMVNSADILIENFRPGVMDNLGLDWDTLHAVNPNLVVTSISNFGQTGPYRDYKASDLIHYGMGGFSSITGDRDREPLLGPQSQSQYQAGLFAFMATMCAVFARGFTAEGQQVDVSIFESVSSVLLPAILRDVGAGIKQIRGELVQSYPSNFFQCKDGQIYLFTPGEIPWENMLAALEIDPAIAKDPRFATGKVRFENAEDMAKLFEPSLMAADRETVFGKLNDWGLTSGPVLSVDELFASEHLKERGFFVDIDHPRTGKRKYPGAPVRMTETPWRVKSPAPILGQHNQLIFCDRLGYSKAELMRLTQMGVI